MASAMPVSSHAPTMTPQCSRDVYASHRLGSDSQHTRLIHLLPGECDEPIRCSLSTLDLQRLRQFEALSYVWGNPDATQTISVDGSPFQVTENLLEALISLRTPDCERVLWVDAVCINQRDMPERNHQVGMMASIYSRAQRVLVWLGPETKASQVAFDFLSRSYQRSPFNRRELMEDSGWVAMRDLYQREYWTRVWIVQEVCLAEHAVIVCGRSQIPWAYISELRKVRKNIWTKYLSSGEHDFMRSFAARVDDVRMSCRNGSCTLWTLLESFSESQCHEIHDKIYGFMGLASDCRNSDVPVDYSKSVRQLFEDVVWFHHQKFQSDTSSPHSAQLMRLSEFLQGYLGNHPRCRSDLDCIDRLEEGQSHRQLDATGTQYSPMKLSPSPLSRLLISASAVMVVEGIPTPDQARQLGASELIQFLDGTITYSHLSFWREKIDSGLSTVYSVDSPGACAILHCKVKTQEEEPTEAFDRTCVIVAAYLETSSNDNLAQSSFKVIAITPRDTCVGDIIFAFVDSHVALVMRKTAEPLEDSDQNGNEVAYGLVGRAQLDFQYLEAHVPLRSRLTPDQSVELTAVAERDEWPNPWPATISTDMSTLQAVTRATLRRRAYRHDGPQLEFMPTPQAEVELIPSDAHLRLIDESQQRELWQDPRYAQFLRAPAVGINNLGSTGYISCGLQTLYHLKPIREAILCTPFESQERLACALQDLFRKLRRSALPVSPSAVIQTFGWEERNLYESQDFFEFWRVFWDRLIQVPALSALQQKLLLGDLVIGSGGYERQESFADYSFDARNGHFVPSLREACGKHSIELSESEHRWMEFRRLPPILLLNAKFYEYDISKHAIVITRGKFEYPPVFDFANVANLSDTAKLDTLYQLYALVVHEDVKPAARYMLYLRPREEDRWVLFFNETVTLASLKEVFEDNFTRGEGDDSQQIPLRTPTVFVFLKKSMLGDLLY